LKSDKGKELLEIYGIAEFAKDLNSVVLLEGEEYHSKSRALLRVALYLDEPWPVFHSLVLFPSFIRDAVYVLISSWRYFLFGKEDTCRVPSPDFKERFVEYCEDNIKAFHRY